jgi:glutamate--cysteine ligase
MFLLHCLLGDSPPDTPQEIAALARNQERIAARGREPGLRLERDGDEAELTQWAGELLDALTPIAAALDAAHGAADHAASLRAARAALADPDRLPSARLLDVMANDFDGSYVRFVRAQSQQARRSLLEAPWPAEAETRFRDLASASMKDQAAIEAADTLPFEDYRQRYLSPQRLQP